MRPRSWMIMRGRADADEAANAIGVLNRRVVFLGAVDSEHNSVCWDVNVSSRTASRRDQSSARFSHYCQLSVPEGGYIEDIPSWNTGFQLISARCQYEFSLPFYRASSGMPVKCQMDHMPVFSSSLYLFLTQHDNCVEIVVSSAFNMENSSKKQSIGACAVSIKNHFIWFDS